MAHPPAFHYTADVIVAFHGPAGLEVLVIERGRPPFVGMNALPGGHVDIDENGVVIETARTAAARELQEETGALVDPDALSVIGTWDTPGRDPRGNYVTQVFAYVTPHKMDVAGLSDARTAGFISVNTLLEGMAFDHAEILAAAVPRLG